MPAVGPIFMNERRSGSESSFALKFPSRTGERPNAYQLVAPPTGQESGITLS